MVRCGSPALFSMIRHRKPRAYSLSNIAVTDYRSSAPPLSSTDTTQLVDNLLSYTETLVDKNSSNIIAFSGGVDSSLVAALVQHTFLKTCTNNTIGSVRAVLGVSDSLPNNQLYLARSVANHIGIELVEVPTNEGTHPTYIENKGKSCYICKNHLYSALEAVASQASVTFDTHKIPVLLFNGTNADDIQDPTRLGLLAAKNFHVRSPLLFTSKEDVRRASRHLGLPNWNYAASPCLRSRLAWGVEATSQHLAAVHQAEERIRDILQLQNSANLRVRMLTGKRAVIELDSSWVTPHVEQILRNHDMEAFFKELGFQGNFSIRQFTSGAVANAKAAAG